LSIKRIREELLDWIGYSAFVADARASARRRDAGSLLIPASPFGEER
jgi:hypothetical protein